MIHDKTLNFSFSGLKSAVRRLVEEIIQKKENTHNTGIQVCNTLRRSNLRKVDEGSERLGLTEEVKMGIAQEFEDAVTEVLVGKTLKAVELYNIETVIVGGGVSANTHIRLELTKALDTRAELLVPSPALATDNAVMIAMAGYFRAIKNEYADPTTLRAAGNLKLGNVSKV